MRKISRRDALAGILGATAAYSVSASSVVKSAAIPNVTNHIDQSEFMFAPGLNYLNTAALGPTPRSVLDQTLKAWYELESDPVMMAYGDGPVHLATDKARGQLAGLINCAADELLITRSATAAMNSLAVSIGLGRGDRVLTTDVEHEGGTNGWYYLKRRSGIEVDVVAISPTDHDVKAIIKRFQAAITKKTKIINVSHVVSSTGLRMPVNEIAAIAKQNGILFIVDGAQAVGGIDVDVKALGCDAYVGTGHKWLMGPKGTGFAYINKLSAAAIQPLEREQGVRFVCGSTGVGSLPLVVGLGAAAEAMKTRGMAVVESRVVELRNRAYAGLVQIPKIQVVSAPPGPLATALVSFKLPDAVDSRSFRDVLLKKYNIVIKVGEKRWFNGNRISPHIFNTEADIDGALAAIRREIS